MYRCDPSTGEVHNVGDDFERPNGLAFSLDESQIYIADTRRNHIRVFPIDEHGDLGAGTLFADCTAGHFDGIRLDDAGRVWAGVGDGVHCFDPDGTLIGKLHLPEDAANLTFGGSQRNLPVHHRDDLAVLDPHQHHRRGPPPGVTRRDLKAVRVRAMFTSPNMLDEGGFTYPVQRNYRKGARAPAPPPPPPSGSLRLGIVGLALVSVVGLSACSSDDDDSPRRLPLQRTAPSPPKTSRSTRPSSTPA